MSGQLHALAEAVMVAAQDLLDSALGDLVAPVARRAVSAEMARGGRIVHELSRDPNGAARITMVCRTIDGRDISILSLEASKQAA